TAQRSVSVPCPLTVQGGSLTLNQPWTLSGTTTTASGGTLATSALLTNSGTLAVNGTFKLNAGGSTAGNDFIYGASSTLVLNNSSQVTVGGAGSQFWPASLANVTVQNGGGAKLSADRSMSGTLSFISGKIETDPGKVLTIGANGSVSGAS